MTAEATPKRGRGRPRLDNPKVQITLRLDSELLDYFAERGGSTSAAINEALHEFIALERRRDATRRRARRRTGNAP